MKHQNTGAPFRRADGTVVERGEVFDPTVEELARRRYKLRAVEGPIAAVPSPLDSSVGVWPLQMSPETYLRLHDDGIHAALARELVEATGQQEGEHSDGDSHE